MTEKTTPQTIGFLANWARLRLILLKAGLLFLVLDLAFALVDPMPLLRGAGIYNRLVPGRERFSVYTTYTYKYMVTIPKLVTNFSTHIVAASPGPNEFRVFVFGDSATWGPTQQTDQTLTAILNNMELTTADGRRMRFYNLAYPESSASKTLLLMDASMGYQPDLIVWNMTLQALYPNRVYHYLVLENPIAAAHLDARYDLASLDMESPWFIHQDFFDKTIVGRRKELNALLRLQIYGIYWGRSSLDSLPCPVGYRTINDFSLDWDNPESATSSELTFEYLYAMVDLAADVPITFVNYPIFIADGENSDLWYNLTYSREEYDAFRAIMAETAAHDGWTYIDAWDVVPPQYFPNDELHRNAEGEVRFAAYLAPHLVEIANQQP